jgi:phage gp36-like protein
MLTDDAAVLVARSNSSKDMGSTLGDLVPICNGILHEFRNHLTLLTAATTEVRTVASSPTVVPEISQALSETESNVQRMTALMMFIDAAVQDGTPETAELDQVIERALRLAAPALGRVAVSFNKPHRIQVRNRGTALECLIAGLIVELARAGSETRDPIYRQQIDVFADVGRGAIVLEIDSNGRRPSAGPWRVALARELAARIGASVTSPAAGTGFIVRLDSSS